jgi:hypothetical protein
MRDIGKENQKTVETTQNLINPISLKGVVIFFFDDFVIFFSVDARVLI